MTVSNENDHAELLANLGWVRSLARSLVRDPALAEDVSQSTLALALERPPRETRGPGLRAWLATVTRSKARELRRSGRRRSHREAGVARPESEPSTLDVVERGSTHRTVVDEVMSLDEPERSTVLLRYLDGLSSAEIARRRGESPAAVRQRLRRSLEKLRERLEERFGGKGPLVNALAPLVLFEDEVVLGSTLGAGVGLSLLGVAGVAVVAAGLWVWRPTEPGASGVPAAQVARAADRQDGTAPETPEPGTEDPGVRVEVADDLPSSVQGRVVAFGAEGFAADARPVAGITVTVQGAGPRLEVETDDRGHFALDLEVPSAEALSLELHVPGGEGFRAAHVRTRLEPGAVLEGILLERVPVDLHVGRVVGPGGEPVPGALVSCGSASSSPLGGLGYLSAGPLETDSPAEPRSTTSDDRGRFAFAGAPPTHPLRAEKDGWLQVNAQLGDEDGDPAHIVLAHTVGLEVEVPFGETRHGPLRVELRLSPEEPQRRGGADSLEVTVEDGRANFPGVWAGYELLVRLRGPDGSWSIDASKHWTFGRERDGLLMRGGADARAVVLETGAPRTLRVPSVEPVRVHGVVVDSDDLPVPRANVAVSVVREGEAPAVMWLTSGAADEAGAFDLELWPTSDARGYFLYCTPEPTSRRDANPDPEEERLLELAPGDFHRPLVVRLAPTLPLAGRIEHEDGRPVDGLIVHRRAGSPPGFFVGAGQARVVNGDFVTRGLLEGAYDLEVWLADENPGRRSLEQRTLRKVELGGDDVDWVLPAAPESARLVMRGHLDGRPITVAPTVFLPATTGASGSALVAGRSPASDRGWPDLPDEPAPLWHHRRKGPGDVELPPLAPGNYRIGVHGYDGETLYPRGLGTVQLESGEQLVDFEFVRAGDLPGRILGGVAGLDLHVALRDAKGRLVPTRASAGHLRYEPLAPTGARGDFHLHQAPVGTYDLLVGTEAELREGRPRGTFPVRVRPGDNPARELRLD